MKRDLLFATITLERQPDKLMRYRQFWQNLASQLPEPDQILLLEASTDELLNRIRRRGRPFEQGVGRQYLDRIAAGIRETYRDAPEGSIHRFDSTNRTELLQAVLARLVIQPDRDLRHG